MQNTYNQQQDIRYRDIAESLLASNSNIYSQNRPLLDHCHSVDFLSSQEVAGGWQRQGRMSSVRRFFCLYCTFDMLFTALLWLICVMLTGQSLVEMWQSEVLGYSIHSSLMDIVGVAIIRFIILVIVYAAIHLNHWSVVAFTTTGTCAFLIAKVFVFDWTKPQQPLFQVLLVLVSFTLSWGEAWFLDCKVLPQELHAQQIMATVGATQTSGVVPYNRLGGPSDIGSIADFYSPTESPDGSPRFGRRAIEQTPNLDDQYKARAAECLDESITLLNTKGWKKDKTGVMEGDVVEVLMTQKYGKLFRLTGVVDSPAEFLFQVFHKNLEELPKWNPTILESQFIRKVTDDIDITYQVTAGGGGGAVKPRDFVNLRIAARKEGRLVNAGVSIEYPGFPPNNKYVRGQNNVGCWSLQDLGSGKCTFQWLMGCDLKGWIPQYVLDVAFATAMFDFLQYLRKFVADKKAEGAL